MVKATSLVSVIAYQELLTTVQIIYSRTFQQIPLLLVAVIWYGVLTTVLTALQSYIERLKAAMKGTREMRAVLIRDPNKLIASSVLSSPKVGLPEIESFARMQNVSEDVLRIIGSNRAWLKSYGVVLGLTKNPKTPLGMSLTLMQRLTTKDLAKLSVDRNVGEALRIAARKKVVANQSGKEKA